MSRIPDCKGKHAAEVVNAIFAIFLIEVDDGLGVTVRSKAVTTFFQIMTKVGVIIDLAVKHNPNVPLFVAHRLMATEYIHDAQPSERERHGTGRERSLLVRPAMAQHARHGFQLLCGGPVPPHIENSADSTHSPFSRLDLFCTYSSDVCFY